MALEKKVIQADNFNICKNLINILIQEAHDVIIPFKVQFPVIYDRRAYLFFLVLIKTITFAYKFQRRKIGNALIATRTDFEIAKRIYEKIQEYQTSKSSLQAVKILKNLPESVEDQFTKASIASKLSMSTRDVGQGLDTLVSSGLANTEKVGGRWVYWKANNPGFEMVTADMQSFETTEEELRSIELPVELRDYINKIEESEVLAYFKEMDEGSEDSEGSEE